MFELDSFMRSTWLESKEVHLLNQSVLPRERKLRCHRSTSDIVCLKVVDLP